jgi:hypothetical protein
MITEDELRVKQVRFESVCGRRDWFTELCY